MTTPYVPTFLTPAASVVLTNAHGGNLSNDSIPFSVLYRTPLGGADGAPALSVPGIFGTDRARPGSFRTTWTQTAIQGTQGASQLVWDSAWTGVPGTSPLPPTGLTGKGLVSGGRVYILSLSGVGVSGPGAGVSAPVSGGNVGAWRYDGSPPQFLSGDLASFYDYTLLGGRIYALGSARVYYSTVQPDGSLSGWTASTNLLPTPNGAASPAAQGLQSIVGYTVGGTSYLLAVGDVDGTNTNAYYSTIQSDGSPGAWTAGANVATASRGYGQYLAFDPSALVVYVIGGWTPNFSGGTTSSACSYGLPSTTTGLVPSWTALSSLPAGVGSVNGGVIVVPGTGSGSSVVAVVSGQTGSPNTQMVNRNAVATLAGITGSWSVQNAAVPVTAGAAAAWTSGDLQSVFSSSGTTYPRWLTVGGFGSSSPTVYTAPLTTSGLSGSQNAGQLGTWLSGTSPGLTGAMLGFGGKVTATPPYSASGLFNAFGQAAAFPFGESAAFTDGDVVLVTAQFTSADGDPSPIAQTEIRIGQPPTVTVFSPVPSSTPPNGAPQIAFEFRTGAGGGPEATWRIQLYQGSTLLADSGVRAGSDNYYAPNLAPRLQSGVTYRIVVTATSSDTPMTATDSTTATATAFFTPNFGTPAAPTLAVSTDGTRGAIVATPTNAASPPAPAPVLSDGGQAVPFVIRSRSLYGPVASQPSAIPNGGPIGARRRPPPAARQMSAWYAAGALHAGTFGVAYTYVTATESPPSPVSTVTLARNGGSISVASISGIPNGVTALRFYFTQVPAGDTRGFVVQQPVSANTCAAFLITNEGNGAPPPPEPAINRIYYRRSGTTPWYLLVDGVSSYAQTLLGDAPSAYWRMEDAIGSASAADATGQGRSAAAVGGVQFQAPGNVGAAVALDGSTGYLSVPDAPWQHPAAAVSVEAWVYKTADANFQRIVSAGGFPNQAYAIQADSSGGVVGLIVGAASAGTSLSLNQWTHLVLTYDGTTVRLYKNGTLASSTPAAGAIPMGSGGVTIGADGTGNLGGNPWNGRLDEVAIYGYALSAAQVSAHYSAAVTPPSLTLMDQLALGVSYDFAASALDGADSVESALSAPVTATPPLPTADTLVLHVAGQPALYAALQLMGGPKLPTKVDAVAVPVFGVAAPVVRYGVLRYHEVEATVRLLDATSAANLKSMIDQALAGQPLYWRDAAGHLLTVGLTPDIAELSHLPASYLSMRDVRLKLVEVPNQFAPSSQQDTVSGLLAQKSGTVQPLDPSEAMA